MSLEAFKTEGVVPDIIDSPPQRVLTVKYGSITLEPGAVLTPTQVKDTPLVEFEADSGSFYTLLMVDPDAPSRKDPKFGEIIHWTVGNIPGNRVLEGEVVAQYFGSGPPQGSGLHRYIFLVFRQPGGKINYSEAKSSYSSREGRRQQKTREFASKYGLKELVAGNFYQAEWDEYVPILHEQLMKMAQTRKEAQN